MNKRSSGFTLVELLIVIVVIAILAAISVVAYNGIQNRAQSSKVVASADAIVKILEMYKTDHGAYPLSEGNYWCVGTVDNYPANTPFEEGACWSSTGSGGLNIARVNAGFNNLLLEYVGSIPDGSTTPTIEGTYGERGLYYFASNYQPGRAYLYYRLPGDISCPRGEKQDWYAGMTACEIIIES